MDRFCRMAYNHYCAVQNMEPMPYQTGVFYKDVTKEPSSVAGAMVWQGACFAGKTDVELTAEMLVDSYQEITPMKLTKGYLGLATPMTGYFTPPASGSVGTYSLVGTFYNTNASKTSTKLELTLTNRDTGSVEQKSEIDFPISTGNGGFAWLCGVHIQFVGGVNYLITIRPTEDFCDMTLSLSIGGRSLSTVSNEGIASASYSIHEPEGGQGGMAVLRCQVTGEGGELTFAWDGVELKPAFIRPARLSNGGIVQDYIFLREDEIAVDSTLSMKFECNMGGNFLFYGWGAMLF
ncbi:MAG: hypothetical protein HDT20_00300 [Oscillibacter sp.]|nr:hypothetical protein [Oscillibacter sp.]